MRERECIFNLWKTRPHQLEKHPFSVFPLYYHVSHLKAMRHSAIPPSPRAVLIIVTYSGGKDDIHPSPPTQQKELTPAMMSRTR
ncbi:hypothetical protein TNCV_2393551 [Trichonephila clavipes]|nr:hypothetical protein TNCV_2393551 [Trichonephila clavipes]